jgi:hypothetical protein
LDPGDEFSIEEQALLASYWVNPDKWVDALDWIFPN